MAMRRAVVLGGDGQLAELPAGDRVASSDPLGPRVFGDLPLERQLPNALAMLAKVAAGTANGTIALLGDSTSFGTGASNRLNDYAHYIAKVLNAAGIPAETDGLWGMPSGFSAAQLAAYDDRVTFTGSGWSGNTTSIAGTMFSNTTDTTSAFAFKPEKQVNAFELCFPVDPQFGSFSVSMDGGAVQTVNQSTRNGVWAWNGSGWDQTIAPEPQANRFGRATFTVPLGTHTFTMRRVSGNVKISGLHGYRTDLRQVHIANWGRPGETAAGWAAGTSYWNLRNTSGFQAIIKPDLTLIDLGINDVNTAVVPAAYAASLQQVIDGAKLSGKDVALMVPVASETSGNRSLPNQQAMRTQIEALAASNTLPILADMPSRWGEYASGSALGYYAAAPDITHPADPGYADKARAVTRPLLWR